VMTLVIIINGGVLYTFFAIQYQDGFNLC
jgi:hypothetical protein